MGLLIEIALTITAWRNGWGAKALFPLAGAFGMGLLLGMAVAATGGKPESVVAFGLIIDVVAIVVLAIMCKSAPAAQRVQPHTIPMTPAAGVQTNRQMAA